VHQNKMSRLALGLCLILLGCSPVSKSEIETEIDIPIPTVTMQAGTPEPLCALGSKYRVGFAEFNTPVSQCNLYFYVDFRVYTYEKFFRIIIQPNKPFTFTKDGYVDLSTINQIKPYHYRWTIKNTQGQVERAWLAYFIKNRDGTYHTIITQPEQDWKNSVLEIYFEDVNNDGVREDVTYEIVVGDFLTKLAP
jgi:hypothetical protein